MNSENKNLDVLVNCFFCNSRFSQSDFSMVDDQQQKTVLHVTCPKCNASAMIFISSTQGGIVSLGMATDLDRKEARQMFNAETISSDDILAAHSLLAAKNVKMIDILK